MPRILRPQELADALHISLALVHKWTRNKVIPYYKVGRCTMFEFDKVLVTIQEHERKATV